MPKLEAPTGTADALCAGLEMMGSLSINPANLFLYQNERKLSMPDQPTLAASTNTFQKVDPVADIKAAQEASTSSATAQHVKDTMLITQLGAYANVAESQVPEEGQLPSVTLHDANFATNMRRAVDLLTTRGIGLPWMERWYGSDPKRGWSIVAGRDEVVYIGGDESMGVVVRAIVEAHNKTVGYL